MPVVGSIGLFFVGSGRPMARWSVVIALSQLQSLSGTLFLFLCVRETNLVASVSPGGAGYLRPSFDRTRESIAEKVDTLGCRFDRAVYVCSGTIMAQ